MPFHAHQSPDISLGIFLAKQAAPHTAPPLYFLSPPFLETHADFQHGAMKICIAVSAIAV